MQMIWMLHNKLLLSMKVCLVCFILTEPLVMWNRLHSECWYSTCSQWFGTLRKGNQLIFQTMLSHENKMRQQHFSEYQRYLNIQILPDTLSASNIRRYHFLKCNFILIECLKHAAWIQTIRPNESTSTSNELFHTSCIYAHVRVLWVQ